MASLPNAPNITIRPDAQDQALKFFWSVPTPNGSPDVSSYELTDGGANIVQLSSTTFFYTYPGLTNGTSYTFRIAASNTNGVGPYAFYRTVQPGLTPGIPLLSTIISTPGSLTYTVGWSNPSDLGGATNLLGTLLTAYPVDSNGNLITTSSLLLQKTVLGGNSNTFQQTLLPLTSNYNYKVLIAPVVDAGYGRIQVFTSTISSSVVAPPSSNFSPSSIGAMQLWLDATDIFGTGAIPANGSTISTWFDKSGRGYNAIGQSNPVFSTISTLTNVRQNLSTVYFNTKSMNAGVQTGSNYSLFMTAYSASAAGYQRILNGGGNLQDNILFVGTSNNGQYTTITGNITAFSNIAPNTPAITVGNTMSLLEIVNAQTTHTPYVFGSNQNQKSNAVVGFSSINIGGICPAFAGAQAFTGYIGEILFYSTVVSAPTRNELEGYLAWKWGLSTLLPSWHPFYTRKPEITDSNLDFSPSSLGGTQVWLDAADTATIIRSGSTSTITSWTDKSGLANNATAVNNPTYIPTEPGVFFNGINQHFTLPNGAVPFSNSSYSYYFMAQFSTVNAGGVIGAGAATNNSSYNIRPESGKIRNYWYFNDIDTVNTFTVNTRAAITSYYSTASVRYLSLNYQSTVQDTPTARTQPNSNNTIGRTVANEYLFGRINEVLVFSTIHSLRDRQRVEGYLAWKWGNQSFLPPTHLYYNRAPTRLDTFTGFSPSTIPGLQLWTDASLFNVADNTSITMFSTLGTSYLGFQGSATVRSNALAGKSVVQILNAQAMSTTGASAVSASNFAIFYVGRQFGGSSNNGRVLQGDANDLYGYYLGQKPRWHSAPTGFLVSGTTGPNSNWDIWTFGRTSANLTTMNWNGSNQYNATNVPTVTGLGFNKGAYSNESSDCQIAEILYFSTSLSSADYSRVEGYFAWKWGLQANLPTSHPFYQASTISLGPIST
jgi:hypothetical protein